MTTENDLNNRVHMLSTALKLVWHIHARAHQHLGLERFSGIEGRCIPCICALALGRTGDTPWTGMFDDELLKIEGESHARS
jgi:hypothetical protein